MSERQGHLCLMSYSGQLKTLPIAAKIHNCHMKSKSVGHTFIKHVLSRALQTLCYSPETVSDGPTDVPTEHRAGSVLEKLTHQNFTLFCEGLLSLELLLKYSSLKTPCVHLTISQDNVNSLNVGISLSTSGLTFGVPMVMFFTTRLDEKDPERR